MNRCEELLNCLASIDNQIGNFDKEVIVVDNASTDDTCYHVKKLFSHATLIKLDRNIYATGGRNRGVAAAQGDICVFLDDDAVFEKDDALEKTLHYLQQNTDTSCIAFAVRNGNSKENESKYIPRFDKKHPAGNYYCGTFCGAGIAIYREAFKKLTGFWEPLLYHCEELDLAYRLTDKNHKILYVQDIVVDHFEVSKARPKGAYLYFSARNRPWVAIRNLPFLYALSTTLMWWGETLRLGIITGQIKYPLKGILDSICGCRQAFATRKPVTPATIRYLKSVSGRLWY